MIKKVLNMKKAICFQYNGNDFNNLDMTLYYDYKNHWYYMSFCPIMQENKDGYILTTCYPYAVKIYNLILTQSKRNTKIAQNKAIEYFNKCIFDTNFKLQEFYGTYFDIQKLELMK